MNTTKKSSKFAASVKEYFRKLIVKLKKNPSIIPFAMLIVSFLVFSLNLTHISNTTATVQGKGMGLCEFASMLFSILSMLCLLNAFPKRQKPNYPMVVLFLVLTVIIIVADILYSVRITEIIAKLGNAIKPAQLKEYRGTWSTLITHCVLMGVTAVTVVLEPVFAKLLKKINTSVEIEETSVGDIELADEE